MSRSDPPMTTPSGTPTLDDNSQELLVIYRDIFAEITAKATPYGDQDGDIIAYIVPKGCIHRAAGKLGFQMFGGELHMKNAMNELRGIRADRDRLREALKRIASMEAFTFPRIVDRLNDEELIARIDFAREALQSSTGAA